MKHQGEKKLKKQQNNHNPYPEITTINILMYIFPASHIQICSHFKEQNWNLCCFITLVFHQIKAFWSWWDCGRNSRMVLEPVTGNKQTQVFSYNLVNGRCCYRLFIIILALPLMPCFVVLDMSCNSSQSGFLI